MAYCNLTTDLVRVARDIEQYKGLKTVLSTLWEDEGTPAIYKLDQSGVVTMVFDDGVEMTNAGDDTAAGSLAGGEFSYQTASDTLLVYLADETDPDLSVMQVGLDWTDVKTAARNDAQEVLEGLLRQLMPTPLPKIPESDKSYNSRDYDFAIIDMCAHLTCWLIIRQVNPDDPLADKLYKKVDNPEPYEVGEKPGMIQRIYSDEISLNVLRTAREAGGYNYTEGASNSTTAGWVLSGRYTGHRAERWKVVIDTGGAPGTATYKWQKERGGTYTDIETSQATRKSGEDDQRVYISQGLYVRFVGTFSLNDEITIELFPQADTPSVHSGGQIRLSRG